MGSVHTFPGTGPSEPDVPQQSVADWLREIADAAPDTTLNAVLLLISNEGLLVGRTARPMSLDEHVGALEIAKQTIIFDSFVGDED